MASSGLCKHSPHLPSDHSIGVLAPNGPAEVTRPPPKGLFIQRPVSQNSGGRGERTQNDTGGHSQTGRLAGLCGARLRGWVPGDRPRESRRQGVPTASPPCPRWGPAKPHARPSPVTQAQWCRSLSPFLWETRGDRGGGTWETPPVLCPCCSPWDSVPQTWDQ